MHTLKIKDLDLSRELSAEEQGAVAGGDNATAPIDNGPVTAVRRPVRQPGHRRGPDERRDPERQRRERRHRHDDRQQPAQGSIAQIAQGFVK